MLPKKYGCKSIIFSNLHDHILLNSLGVELLHTIQQCLVLIRQKEKGNKFFQYFRMWCIANALCIINGESSFFSWITARHFPSLRDGRIWRAGRLGVDSTWCCHRRSLERRVAVRAALWQLQVELDPEPPSQYSESGTSAELVAPNPSKKKFKQLRIKRKPVLSDEAFLALLSMYRGWTSQQFFIMIKNLN